MKDRIKELENALQEIREILENSNIYPSTDCRLYLSDGKKVIEIIEKVIPKESGFKSDLQFIENSDIM